VLSAETRIRLESDEFAPQGAINQVFVAEGVVSAQVGQRPSDKPLVLYTPLAELQGTAGRYSFASLPEGTFLETDAGKGRFTRKMDGSVIDVSTGQFAVASLKNEPFQSRNVPNRLTIPRRTIIDGNSAVLGLFFDPEGLSVTCLSSEGAHRWDLGTGRQVWSVRNAGGMRRAGEKVRNQKDPLRPSTFSQDGRLFALSPEERMVKVFDNDSGSEKNSFQGAKRITAVCLSPDGHILAVAKSNIKDGQEVRLYDTVFGLERTILTGQNGVIQCLAFSSNGNLLATASADRSIKIWQVQNLSLVRSLSKSSQEPRTLAFSPDDHLLAIGERKGAVRLVDPQTGVERFLLNGHLRDVWSVAFSPDGRFLLSGAADNTARLWSLDDGRELHTLKVPNIVTSVAFSPDGRILATGTWEKRVLLWDRPADRP